jgi:hypothetical protein
MPEVVKWPAFAVGIVIFLSVSISLLRVFIVPRGLSSKVGATVGWAVRRIFLLIANRFDTYEAKDRVLALQAPIVLFAFLITALGSYLLAFALMLWPFNTDFPTALRESGSSLLTLGFAGRELVGPTVIHLSAAAAGLAVVALLIAYLPTIYGAFNRRELLVTVLQSRAGSPAWGPEILARHAMNGLLGDLPHFYSEWERWAADVAETHTNYLVLLYFRSPQPLRSWLVGLLAVMDSAAIQLAISPSTAPVQARLMLRMGFTALRDIASATGIPYDPDPMPDDHIELTFEEFRAGIARIERFDFPMERTAEEAWPHFHGWRVNYESIVYALGDLIVAPPGPWSGTRQHLPDLMLIPHRPLDRSPVNPMKDAARRTDMDRRA